MKLISKDVNTKRMIYIKYLEWYLFIVGTIHCILGMMQKSLYDLEPADLWKLWPLILLYCILPASSLLLQKYLEQTKCSAFLDFPLSSSGPILEHCDSNSPEWERPSGHLVGLTGLSDASSFGGSRMIRFYCNTIQILLKYITMSEKNVTI